MAETFKPTYKVVIIGDGGVGKTSYMKRLITKQFEQKYLPTIGVEVFTLELDEYILNIWDCAGQDKFSGLADGYYINADAAIIMCSMDSKISIKNIAFWNSRLNRVIRNIPKIFVCNKCDNKYSFDTKSKYLTCTGEKVYTISVRDNIRIDAPIKQLLKQLNLPKSDIIKSNIYELPISVGPIINKMKLVIIGDNEEDKLSYINKVFDINAEITNLSDNMETYNVNYNNNEYDYDIELVNIKDYTINDEILKNINNINGIILIFDMYNCKFVERMNKLLNSIIRNNYSIIGIANYNDFSKNNTYLEMMKPYIEKYECRIYPISINNGDDLCSPLEFLIAEIEEKY